jgi:hypothetical protein
VITSSRPSKKTSASITSHTPPYHQQQHRCHCLFFQVTQQCKLTYAGMPSHLYFCLFFLPCSTREAGCRVIT